MRSKRLALLAIAAALLAAPASAQQKRWQPEDHLEPDGSLLSGYPVDQRHEGELRDLFQELFDSSIAVRMVAQPSFIPEYAVGLRESGTIVTLTLTKTHDMVKRLANGSLVAPPVSGNYDVHRCERSISFQLKPRIVAVWHKMLANTHYSAQYPAGLDGAVYDFSMTVPRVGWFAGHVWTPDRNSATGNLVALANAMRDVCEKKAGEAELNQLTTELEQRIQKGEGK